MPTTSRRERPAVASGRPDRDKQDRDKLDTYRAKRDARRTPEPVPTAAVGAEPSGAGDTFVIQEHHARRLHWDVRLERDGVLVSFAVPKGLPEDTKTMRLAVHTEDHPMEYADFSGEIPKGEYGGGRMFIWDKGRYETLKWMIDKEIDVVLHGDRVDGRFTFIKTAQGWLVKRRGAASRPNRVAAPEQVLPMLATVGEMPKDQTKWAFEFKWDGIRAIARVEGGRVRFTSRVGNDFTVAYPELQGLGEQLGATEAVLDCEIVQMVDGRPSFSALQHRMHVTSPQIARTFADKQPVTLLIFDLLHLDGNSCLGLPYEQRRRLLERLELRGTHWQTPQSYPGAGDAVLAATVEHKLEGVVAKRLTSTYTPGRRSPDWIKITHWRTQDVVVGGWRTGEGKRAGVIGSLLLGVPEGDGLRFVGSVGTGFDAAELTRLTARLKTLTRKTSPFVTPLPPDRARGALWVTPTLVGEVAYRLWTPDGRMRAPAWRGLRVDVPVTDVRLPEDLVIEDGAGDGG